MSTQVIVTCRTEYLEAKGSYRGLFDPRPGSASSTLQELFVRSFGAGQVSRYFEQWVTKDADRDGNDSDVSRASGWSARRYVDVIEQTPGLKELAQTPFVLRAMADALPRLDKRPDGVSAEASADSVGSSRRVTRADVYAAFIDQCWESETQRLRRNWPPGLPPDYDAPLSFTNYCTDLAMDMLARNQVLLFWTRLAPHCHVIS